MGLFNRGRPSKEQIAERQQQEQQVKTTVSSPFSKNKMPEPPAPPENMKQQNLEQDQESILEQSQIRAFAYYNEVDLIKLDYLKVIMDSLLEIKEILKEESKK